MQSGHPNCHQPMKTTEKKKGKRKWRNQFRTTYSVAITYLTHEIYERFRHVDPQLGRRFRETTSELLRDKLALCDEAGAHIRYMRITDECVCRAAKPGQVKNWMKSEETETSLDAPNMSTTRSYSRSLLFPTSTMGTD